MQPKMIVTASFGMEPGRRVAYVPLVEKALELSSHRPSKVLVYCRDNMVRNFCKTRILGVDIFCVRVWMQGQCTGTMC